MDDLVCSVSSETAAGYLHRQRGSYKSIGEDPWGIFDMSGQCTQILGSLRGVVVRGLVDKDTAHAESCCFILLGPGGVSRDLGADFVQGPMAVVDPDIADGVDIRVGVEAGDFTGVVGVGGGDVAWATVGVDNDQEAERGIRLNSVWFNGVFLFLFSIAT